MMWLSNKLKQLSEVDSTQSIDLSTFYSKYILNSVWYELIENGIDP